MWHCFLFGHPSDFDEGGVKEFDVETAAQSKPEATESEVDSSLEVQTSSPSQKRKGTWSSVGSAAKRVGSGVKRVGSGAKKIGSGVTTGVKKVGGGVATGVKKVGGGVASGARTVGGGVAGGAKKLTTGVKVVGGGVAGGAKKLTSGVKKVSRQLILRQRRKDADKGKSSYKCRCEVLIRKQS